MCLTVLERSGSGNPVFIGIDLLYLGSLPVFRNVSLVLRSFNLHILQLFYVDSRSVCSRIKPLNVEAVCPQTYLTPSAVSEHVAVVL